MSRFCCIKRRRPPGVPHPSRGHDSAAGRPIRRQRIGGGLGAGRQADRLRGRLRLRRVLHNRRTSAADMALGFAVDAFGRVFAGDIESDVHRPHPVGEDMSRHRIAPISASFASLMSCRADARAMRRLRIGRLLRRAVHGRRIARSLVELGERAATEIGRSLDDRRGRFGQLQAPLLLTFRLDVGQQLVGLIADIPDAIRAMLLAGLVSHLLRGFVVFFLETLASLGQQFDGFVLVALARRDRHRPGACPACPGTAPSGCAGPAQTCRRLDRFVDVALVKLFAPFWRRSAASSLVRMAGAEVWAVGVPLPLVSARAMSSSNRAGLSSLQCRSAFSAAACSAALRACARSPAARACRPWRIRARALSVLAFGMEAVAPLSPVGELLVRCGSAPCRGLAARAV